MKVHVVGGFLGSGKTTTIAAAAKRLMSQGARVGIVTNDQGKYLVDTAFFRALALPAVEVTGGCFCCNYDDLDARLAQLEAEHQPDVIFAESVGSCADVVATVIAPLLQLSAKPASLSVLTDSRLLLRRLQGQEMPFADDVIYIFDKQIEEASILVVNKCDLLDAAALDRLNDLCKAAYPRKRILMQSAFNAAQVDAWLDVLANQEQHAAPLEIDYAQYGAGEAALTWLDARFTLAAVESSKVQMALIALQKELEAAGAILAHLKLILDDGAQVIKVSVTAADDKRESLNLPAFKRPIAVTLNLRAQIDVTQLESLVRESLVRSFGADSMHRWDAQCFAPAMPRPTHRFK